MPDGTDIKLLLLLFINYAPDSCAEQFKAVKMHITNGKLEAFSYVFRDWHLLLDAEVLPKSRQKQKDSRARCRGDSWSSLQCVSPGPFFLHSFFPYKPCCHMWHMVEVWRLLRLLCSFTNDVPCMQRTPTFLSEFLWCLQGKQAAFVPEYRIWSYSWKEVVDAGAADQRCAHEPVFLGACPWKEEIQTAVHRVTERWQRKTKSLFLQPEVALNL